MVKKGNGKRASAMLGQIKQFYKMRDQGHDALFFGEDFVIVDRVRFTKDASELVEALFGMVCEHCKRDGQLIDSEGIGIRGDALLVLAKHAKVIIRQQEGKRIVAEVPKGGA